MHFPSMQVEPARAGQTIADFLAAELVPHEAPLEPRPGVMKDSRSARLLKRVVRRLVGLSGLPPTVTGFRWVREETVEAYLERAPVDAAARYQQVHAPSVASNPLPRNVRSAEDLPSDRGWWGFSFRDVPSRRSEKTIIATVPKARVVSFLSEDGEYHPAILSGENTSLKLPQIRFLPKHVEGLRSGVVNRIPRATWVLERVYHNHTHWLTAHLPKLLLLRQMNRLENVILPPGGDHALIDQSLAMIDVRRELVLPSVSPQVLEVEELTVVGTDRFRPELVRLVRSAVGGESAVPPGRMIYISRKKASRRNLSNRAEVEAVLRHAGFETVVMEDLTFAEQVALMRETRVLAGLHGAGLGNMIFCAEGAHVLEIMDPGYPSPNFYALAAALGHHYWLVAAEGVGGGKPGWRDLRPDPRLLEDTVRKLLAESSTTPTLEEGRHGAEEGR